LIVIKIVTLNGCDAIRRWPSGAECAGCAGLRQISQKEPAERASMVARPAQQKGVAAVP